MSFKIGLGITLREHIKNCIDESTDFEWMIFSQPDYSLEMMVYPVILDDWDLEPEEYEKIEEAVLSEKLGYGNLLSNDQLVDVVLNIESQKNNYSDMDLEAAINHYDKRDAFITL
ncbi:DUF7716 domain-containing protein [Shewanella fidelis]|uniref:DUF7716 domain-containing protein n=1 Tax=Shewanella fidelis TaxID=173509 RepID=UPI00048C69D4|nr:hypothetical protein [Shewanella fidelis]